MMEWPRTPCKDCLWNFQGKQGEAIWAYCAHRESGALKVLFKGSEWPWRVYSPTSYAQFMQIVTETLAKHKQLIEMESKAEEALGQMLEQMPADKLAKT